MADTPKRVKIDLTKEFPPPGTLPLLHEKPAYLSDPDRYSALADVMEEILQAHPGLTVEELMRRVDALDGR